MSGFTRREFLQLAAGASAAATWPHRAAANDVVRISILHTTDLHGHILPTTGYDGQENVGGLARCATQIGRWRAENPNSLLIDVGDVYQGTDVALQSRGELMIDLLNMLRYDAWVVGNHEFDWGFDAFQNAVKRSAMPVLGANIFADGKQAGGATDGRINCAPFVIKEFDGVRVAVVGITTPGMPFWFLPEFTGGLEFRQPIEPVRQAIAAARAGGAHAIVLAGHMGLKERIGGDDFANTVISLTTEFPDVAAFVAGHTHQPISSRSLGGVLFTQADHFGIHAGRVELWIDRETKRLVSRRAQCDLMDASVPLDPVVMSRGHVELDDSERRLDQPVGRLADRLNVDSRAGAPSEVEELIGTAIAEALHERGVHVDGVLHGLFDDTTPMAAGEKTVRDVWDVLPYENFIATAELTPAEITAVLEEIFQTHEIRNLMGFDVQISGRGAATRVTQLRRYGDHGASAAPRYRIAFNTFDARSAGHRFMRLRALLERADARSTLHHIQTRDALIGCFQRHKVLHKSDIKLAATRTNGGHSPLQNSQRALA